MDCWRWKKQSDLLKLGGCKLAKNNLDVSNEMTAALKISKTIFFNSSL